MIDHDFDIDIMIIYYDKNYDNITNIAAWDDNTK